MSMERSVGLGVSRLAPPPTAAPPPARHAFGPEAERIAGWIAGDLPIISCEPALAAEALDAALTLRRNGVHFALSVHLEDARARLARERSLVLCATYATWDEVRLVFDQWAATIVEERSTIPDADRAVLVEVVRLADSVIVRSWAEHARLVAAIGSIRRDVDVVVNEDRSVRAFAATPTDVVVYAPQARSDELAPFVTALADLALPVTIVARDRPTIAGPIRFEPPERAAEVLGRARVIVDATSNDPGTSLALARLGRPLAVSSASGAAELLRGARSYDIWDRRSILTAAVNGLGANAPVVSAGHSVDRPGARAAEVRDEEPLVSVIVATYNRPQSLAATLATIARQSYPALDIVVVNDGGSDVRAVVANVPGARLIERQRNRGPAAARNTGLAAARGPYVMFFDDDDEMFPDHVGAHVAALQRSGLDVAYGQMINRFAVPADRHPADAFAGHTSLLDHADIQWAGAIAPTAVLFRRSLIDKIGVLDETLPGAEDYDFWARLAAGREWARVSDVTSMYLIHGDGSNYSAQAGVRRHLDAHRTIYEKHPTSRPLVHAGRAAMLQFFGQGNRNE
jgi:GT2 family glycosyltransferase